MEGIHRVPLSGRCAEPSLPLRLPSIEPMLMLPPTVPAAQASPCHSCCPSRCMGEPKPRKACAQWAGRDRLRSWPAQFVSIFLFLFPFIGFSRVSKSSKLRCRTNTVPPPQFLAPTPQGCRSIVQHDLPSVATRTRSATCTQSLVSSAVRPRPP